jgi:D-alanine-D-alanine ligase-like ATP-grasp enzyme/ribosomal protein S18 acetylase RimI-like enzyme
LGLSERALPRRLACTLNLEIVEESLTEDRPNLVFNLVESLGGSDRLAHLAAVLLDDLDLHYTGASAASLHLTNNKPRAKERLRLAGLPTPNWSVVDCAETVLPPPYIIKAVWEHASVGLDDHAVIQGGDGSTVGDQIASRSRQLGQTCFAEQFVEGREFNLSLIATSEAPRVLPPAEIDFSAFPVGKPRIVGYAAKWDERAMEFAGTPRRFDFPKSDAPLLDWLRTLALDCWRLFDLAGYARVDFRVDSRGQPWILEVNANPCLSPDAGFSAALARANLPFDRVVSWILEDAQQTKGVELGGRDQERPINGQKSEIKGQETKAAREVSAATRPAKGKKAKRSTTTKLRTKVAREDCEIVRQIVSATGLFRLGEIDVAVELVQARLEKGAASGYEFVFAEQGGEVVGYICFGRNAITVSSFDVYWIAVEPSQQGQGIGQLLLEEAERQISAAGGTRIYIETSHRSDYQATRGFYENCGYSLAAVLDDFYAPGDGKATYLKVIGSTAHTPA